MEESDWKTFMKLKGKEKLAVVILILVAPIAPLLTIDGMMWLTGKLWNWASQ